MLSTQDFVLKLADMGEARLITSAPKRDTPPIPAMNWAPPEVSSLFLHFHVYCCVVTHGANEVEILRICLYRMLYFYL